MDQVTLHAAKRDDFGSRPARRMRREGQVPAVVYGKGMDAVTVSVNTRELFGVLHTEAGLNALINLDLDGDGSVLTVAREIQRHPVRGDITHLDFIQVSLDEEIEADVTIEYVGTPAGVREEGGFVETIEATVFISALPTAIPSSIELSVEDLNIGDTVRIADLPTIEGVTYLDDLERPLLTVLAPRLEEEEPEEELEEGELAEGEEGEAAEEGAEGEDTEESEGG